MKKPALVWKDPPTSNRGKTGGRPNVWGPIIDELRRNRGKWALVIEASAQPRAYMRAYAAARLRGLSDEIEVSQRKRPDGLFDIYARAKP